jgi:hypothetical protein
VDLFRSVDELDQRVELDGFLDHDVGAHRGLLGDVFGEVTRHDGNHGVRTHVANHREDVETTRTRHSNVERDEIVLLVDDSPHRFFARPGCIRVSDAARLEIRMQSGTSQS